MLDPCIERETYERRFFSLATQDPDAEAYRVTYHICSGKTH